MILYCIAHNHHVYQSGVLALLAKVAIREKTRSHQCPNVESHKQPLRSNEHPHAYFPYLRVRPISSRFNGPPTGQNHGEPTTDEGKHHVELPRVRKSLIAFTVCCAVCLRKSRRCFFRLWLGSSVAIVADDNSGHFSFRFLLFLFFFLTVDLWCKSAVTAININ